MCQLHWFIDNNTPTHTHWFKLSFSPGWITVMVCIVRFELV